MMRFRRWQFAAGTLHFLIFVLVLLPFHSRFCGNAHSHFASVISSPEHHSGLAGHNPDNCGLCRSHTQTDVEIVQSPGLFVGEMGLPVLEAGQSIRGLIRPTVIDYRAPPTRS